MHKNKEIIELTDIELLAYLRRALLERAKLMKFCRTIYLLYSFMVKENIIKHII